MERKYETYQMSAVRIWNGQQMYILNNGYKLVNSSYAPTGLFITTQRDRTGVKEDTFMVKVIDAETYNQTHKNTRLNSDVYERDIVTYKVENNAERFMGVVVFSKELYIWAIKAIHDGKLYPLFKVCLEEVIGNIYQTPELINGDEKTKEAINLALKGNSQEKTSIENVEALSHNSVPLKVDASKEKDVSTGGYAYLNEPIPGLDGPANNKKEKKEVVKEVTEEKPKIENVPITDVYIDVVNNEDGTVSWKYTLSCNGKKKSDSRAFNKTGTTQYYILAAAIISLSKLRTPKKVVLHTRFNSFNDVINKKLLYSWEKNGWKKADNTPVSQVDEFIELKGILDKLQCEVVAENIS